MFTEQFQYLSWEEVKLSIHSKTKTDVERALCTHKRTLDDFQALISPAALPYLEQMAKLSNELTQKRFGKTIQLFAPLYVSNECHNICTYCGFSFDNKLNRKTLTENELLQEAELLKQQGFNHVLLVSGEANHTVNTNYFLKAIELLKYKFSTISIEVQPLESNEYAAIQAAGGHSILVYQETYHQDVYKKYHPKGKKSNFQYRLETPDRIGSTGMHKIGLGVLLGLEDWRTDSFFCAAHLEYLQKKYWQTKYSVSFPRMRPAEGIIEPNVIVTDRELLQLICAYRLLNENVEISISTRESENFRDHVIRLGATSMSAGSKTNPGGYAADQDSLKQFEICDERGVKEFVNVISEKGYEAVWKDWDMALQ